MCYFVLNYMTSFHIICIILCQITWHHFISYALFCVKLHDIISCHMHYFVLNYMTSFHVTCIILCQITWHHFIHMHYFVLNYMTSFHVTCIICVAWYLCHMLFCARLHDHHCISHALFCVKLHDIISYHMHYFVLNYMTSFHITCIILC